MRSKRIVLIVFCLVFAACSSHEQSGAVPRVPAGVRGVEARSGAVCAMVPASIGPTIAPFSGDVGGVSDSDAWAIGGGPQAMYHFDGAAWRLVPPPVIPIQKSHPFVVLNGLAPIASDDAWSGGFASTAAGQSVVAFFLHWNGSAWVYVPGAPSLTNGYQIDAVAGDASNDVWAIAQPLPPEGIPNRPVALERWDGTRWSLVTSLSASNGFFPGGNQMLVFGPHDVWLRLGTLSANEIVHWDGIHAVRTIMPRATFNGPAGGFLSGTSDRDLWFDSNGSNGTPYIYGHSSSWGPYDTSLISGYGLSFSIDFRPGYAVILAGDPHGTPSLLVYNGYVRWRPTVSPLPSETTDINTASVVKGATSFWMAFSIGDSEQVALVKCPSTPPVPTDSKTIGAS